MTVDTAETHKVINPAILYMGTPVLLISTLNDDGTPNLAPMSSAFWLGHRCILGLASYSQTTKNILRTRQCVLNLPSDDMAANVNGIARTTGSKVIPQGKLDKGYTYQPDKFGAAMLEPQPSDLVEPPRASKCPVQMEAELVTHHSLMGDQPDLKGRLTILEVKVIRVHAMEKVLLEGYENRIDPDRWKPLIMSFQRLYGLSNEVAPSVLAKIDEEKYRLPVD
jgi:flavin reductase (DIM6/NTAB) family NADH-FMN oxidoreductase RutF